MKTTFKSILSRIATSLMLVLFLTACDTSSSLSGDDDSGSLAESVSFLVSDLGLSASETAALTDSFAKFGGDSDKDPGFLWYVAAEMQATLTEEQKARLFQRLEQSNDRRQGPGMRPGGQQRPNGQGMRQGKPGQDSNGGGISQIELTDDQKAQIKTIHESYKPQFEAILSQRDSLTRDEIKTQIEALREQVRAEVEGVLTDDQKAQLDQLKADAEARRAERELEKEANREAAKLVMIEVLGLTDDEVAAMDALHASREADRQTIQDLIDTGADRETVQAAAEELRAAHEEAVAAILDETQLEITMIHKALAQRMQNRKGKGGKGGPGGQGGPGRQGGRGQGGPRAGGPGPGVTNG